MSKKCIPCFKKLHMARAILITVGLLSAGSLPALAQQVSTDFEGIFEFGTFTIGTPPNTATFAGGQSKTAGIGHLYHSGGNSWMIPAGGKGTITFETPAADVTLFFKDQTSAVGSRLVAQDEANVQVFATDGSTDGPEVNGFTKVTITNSRVKTITLTNNAPPGSNSPYAVIDDLSFTPAAQEPEPDPEASISSPQFVTGMTGEIANKTRVIVRNNHDSAATGKLVFKVMDPDGMPTNTPVLIAGEAVNTLDFDLPPFGSLDIETDGTEENLLVGVVEVIVLTGDDSKVEATVVFSVLGNFVSIDALKKRDGHQAYVSVVPGVENTGIAAYNPSATEDSTLKFILVDDEGNVRAMTTVVLGPMEQLVVFVTDPKLNLFADVPGATFKGTLNIRVTGGPGVVVVGLIQRDEGGELIAVATSPNALAQ